MTRRWIPVRGGRLLVSVELLGPGASTACPFCDLTVGAAVNELTRRIDSGEEVEPCRRCFDRMGAEVTRRLQDARAS